MRRGQPEQTDTLCEPGTLVGRWRGRALGLKKKKNLQMVFLPSLAPSLVVLLCGQQQQQTHHPLAQPCRGFPGVSQALENPKGLQESKLAARRGQELSQAQRQVRQRGEKQREKQTVPQKNLKLQISPFLFIFILFYIFFSP